MENQKRIMPGIIEIVIGALLLLATPLTALILGSFISYAVIFLGVIMLVGPFLMPKVEESGFTSPKILSIIMGIIFIAIGIAWISDPGKLLATIAIFMGIAAIFQGVLLIIFASTQSENKILFWIIGTINIAFGLFIWTTNNKELVLIVIAISFLSTGIQKMMIYKSK
jgi:uncharacterized membrane protein HdeD (DUF308 family)